MSGPTEAGFQTFIRNNMRIDTNALPNNDPIIGEVYNSARTLVNPAIATVPNPNRGYPSLYARAVYNLGGNFLVYCAQDTPPSTYFTTLRSQLKLSSFVAGVINSSGDQGTSQSLTVPEAFNNFTIANLEMLKTPWGRVYLGIAQSYGPTIWGIS